MYSVMLSYNFVLQCLTNHFKEKCRQNCGSPRSSCCANHQVFNVNSYYTIFIFKKILVC